ncbi:MAG: glycosyltransferase [Ignavibacteriaceae bacterium]|nr:glycosyltransferase [Ignavibacteriaceae bacterium]MCW9065591.1 glycosyltransferase [Ignavibacteriaceae bacterium]
MPKKKILFLFYRSPLNFETSNDKRQFITYSALKEKYEVKILTFGELDVHNDQVDIVEFKRSSLKKIFNFLIKLQSPRLTHYQSQKFYGLLIKILNSFQPDVIYVEHLLMMQYVVKLRTNAKIIFFNDESNLYVEENNLRGNFYQKIRNIGLAKLELEACKKADFILTITEDEEIFLKQKKFKNVFSVPYGVDPDFFTFNWIMPKERSILFLGDFSHYPNRQAVRILIQKIYPALQGLGVKLEIIGRNINQIKNLKSEAIEFFENVTDVRPFYYDASVLVAPIFSGAGMRVKILEAALSGIPLIISPVANLGINLVDSEEALICKSVKEFQMTLKNFFSPKFESKIDIMRKNAQQKVAEQFNESILKEKILVLFNTIVN